MKKSKTRGKSTTGGSKKDSPTSLDIDVLGIHGAEFLPGLLETKWQEILEDEERDLMILEIRDEIINGSLEVGYSNYLERQTISFAVHCSALAWIKLLDWYFMPKDPGEPSINTPSWSTDNEPENIAHDTWAAKVMPVEVPELVEEIVPTKEPSDLSIGLSFEDESIDSMLEYNDFPGMQRVTISQELRKMLSDALTTAFELAQSSATVMRTPTPTPENTTDIINDTTSNLSRLSTFTKVLSVPKKDLPKTGEIFSLKHQSDGTKSMSYVDTKIKRELEEQMLKHSMMKPLQMDILPEDRIEVKYVITMPDAAGDSSRRNKNQPGTRKQDKKPHVIRLK